MTNEYFNASNPVSRHALAKAVDVNNRFTSVKAGFDKLPTQERLNEGKLVYAIDTGSANTYLASMPVTLNAYRVGQRFSIYISATNTGPSTLNIDSLGARSIKLVNGLDIQAGDLVANNVYDFVYNGDGNMVMQSPAASHLAGIANNLSGNPNFSGGPVFSGSPDFSAALNKAAIRTALGVAIGSDVQAHDAGLDDIAGLTPNDGNIIVGNGSNWVAESPALARASLGLTIGSQVQAYSATLAATTASFLTSHKAKLDWLAVTQSVDLDAIETRVNELDAAVVLQGEWNASAGTFPGSGTAQAGQSWIISTGGTVNGVQFNAGDRIVALTDNASTITYASNWLKLDYTDRVSDVVGLTGAISKTSLLTALNVENGATANPNALNNVAEDTTPQLGASLDAQSNDITDVGKLLVGRSSGTYPLDVQANSSGMARFYGNTSSNAFIAITGSSGSDIAYIGAAGGAALSGGGVDDFVLRAQSNLILAANGNFEAARADTSRNFLIGKTSTSFSATGTLFTPGGIQNSVADGTYVAAYNRLSSDGALIEFWQDTVLEGSISVSNNTVSYNNFLGAHYSELVTEAEDLPLGTIVETAGGVCDDEGNGRLPKFRVGETRGSKAVYGTVLGPAWTREEDSDVKLRKSVRKKYRLSGVGAGWVRMKVGEMPEIGDLVQQSDVRGCADVQDDDIVRSKTVAKITSLKVKATYADGSFVLPAVILAG